MKATTRCLLTGSISLLLFCMVLCNKPTGPADEIDDPQGFNPVLSSSTQEIRDFLLRGNGSTNAKLVFVKKIRAKNTNFYTLLYIDFSENNDTPVVHTIAAAQGAQVPVISPDGEWAVFAKGSGITEAGAPPVSKSSAYLCKIEENASPVLLVADSAFEPRFIQNSDTLTVISPTKASNFAWCGIGKTMQLKINLSGSAPVFGKPEVLFSTAGFTGGLSFNGQYLCGGGGNVGMVDMTSGNSAGDTVTDFAQACNASISSSQYFTNTVLYLTTAGSHPNINGGKMWDSWQAILINDITKNVLKGFLCPDSASVKFPIETDPPSFKNTRWHHCEWSNHPYFAVATLNVNHTFSGPITTEYQERIYLINLKDSTYLEVLHADTIKNSGIEGDNSGYHWPWLWVEIPPSFQEDPVWLSP